jgi:hypothetical protein
VPIATQRPLLVSQRWLAEQAAHVAPAMPHWLFDWLPYATHVVPLQQPFGHDVALQTHAPALEQVVPLGQAAHAPPLMPHVCADPGEWHCLLLSQQPPAHDEALQAHAPFTQVWPVAQAVQLAPPVPQVALAEVRHWPLESQQPFGQDVALQTQAPCALQA